MFRAVIILAICDILCLSHGFTGAMSKHDSPVKRSRDLANRRTLHGLERKSSFDSEYRHPVSHGRVHRKHKHVPGGRGLFTDLVRGAAGVAKKVAVGALKTGHKIVMPSLQGVEWVTGKVSKALDGRKKLLKSIVGAAKDALKKVQAIEFPGKSIAALIFPMENIVAIVDEIRNEVMNFTSSTKDAVKATLAYSLYAALKVIFAAVSAAIKNLGFACMSLPKTKLEPNIGLVNTVEISGGTVCGLDSLHPKNNVTITRDDGKFLVVSMPWAFNHLKIKMGSVDISGWTGSIIEGQPLEATIKEIALHGTISLQKGTFLKFLSLHLEIGEMSGVNIKLGGSSEEGGMAADLISSLGGALGGYLRDFVNQQLTDMETQISEFLLGNTVRRRK